MNEYKYSELMLDEYLEDVWKCIRCGFCNSVCPTSNTSFSYMSSKTSRGRIILLQAYFSGILRKPLRDRELQELLDYCFGCRRCLEVCPPGVRIPYMLWRAKHIGRRHNLLNKLLYSNYGSFEKLCSNFPSLSNNILRSRFGKILLELLVGIDRRIDFPEFHDVSLEKWIRKNRSSISGKRLAYFIDVFTNYHEVGLGIEVVRLVEKLGYSVEVPDQREAGTLLLEAGMMDKAIKVAKENVESLYKYIMNGASILTSSPAAYIALKYDYPEILGDSKSKLVSEKTLDIIELLIKEYEDGRIRFNEKNSGRIIYHHSCFTKASGLTKHIKRLLTLAGYNLIEVEECCGIGGVWGMSKKHYNDSLDVGSNLFIKLRSLSSPVASQSETCRIQIRNNAKVRVEHPFSYISKAIELK
ncbi:MAG: 4Fe-4S dicluster domain-containing protein [Nitrososphaeria archaeon]|nr:4Fe-4S dicluster domain-containing protein [Nitrososphaeria archaeon]